MDIVLERKRQVFHLVAGMAIAFLVSFSILNVATLFFILAAGVILIVLSKKRRLPVIGTFLRHFDREASKFPGEGAFYLVLGSFLALLLFPKDIALASIMILAVGDSLATLFGLEYGKTGFFKKSLEGSLGGFIPALFAALFFVGPLEAFVGALAGMLLEANEFHIKDLKLDDNVLIPLGASLAISIMRLIL